MGELGDVLELVHRAPGEYRTVRATLRQWSHNERQQRAWERYRTEQRSTRSGGAQVAIARSGDPDAEPPIESEATVRIWHERPARTREERGDPSGTAVSLQYGSTWWHYSPALGAMSNEDDPSQGMDVGQQLDELFHPAPLLASTEVDVLGEVRQAARPAISVRARRRPVPRGSGTTVSTTRRRSTPC